MYKKHTFQNGMIEELVDELNNLTKTGDYIPQTELVESIIRTLLVIDDEL